MDYQALGDGIANSIPFVKRVGITFESLGPDGATAVLPDDPDLANHVGSQHAAGLFTLAETASGGAFVGSFAELLGEITPLAKSAQISYLKLAKGPIAGTAQVPEPDALKEQLSESGKIEFQIPVSMTDAEGTEVATAIVDWHVRKNS